ncbi:MAG TPA: hypothetical protein VHO23_02465 [Candidatus Paceibacterota bacterium]|nr:hypothetical protein [Candidatus Paceibacterota bacterium]
MGIIVPALLPKSRVDLENKLARLSGLVTGVQIDIVDGRFAAPATWPYAPGSHSDVPHEDTLPHLGEFRFELDLMVENAGAVAGSWIDQGVTRLTIHAESAHDLPKLLKDLERTYGYDKGFAPGLLSIGLSLGIATDLALIEPYLGMADYVQFMGIASIGKQGEPFDPRVLQRVKAFRKRHPDMPMQVDGGVSLHTAPALLDAGVSRLIVGSALWKGNDPKAEIEKFNELAQEYGIYE